MLHSVVEWEPAPWIAQVLFVVHAGRGVAVAVGTGSGGAGVGVSGAGE